MTGVQTCALPISCSSSVVIDIGITGSSNGFVDPDAYVDAYDATGASYAARDTADAAPMLTCKEIGRASCRERV